VIEPGVPILIGPTVPIPKEHRRADPEEVCQQGGVAQGTRLQEVSGRKELDLLRGRGPWSPSIRMAMCRGEQRHQHAQQQTTYEEDARATGTGGQWEGVGHETSLPVHAEYCPGVPQNRKQPWPKPGLFSILGAGHEIRTRDPCLGKAVLYH
jgi:hypothetical protein